MVRTPDAVKTAAQRFTSPLRSPRLTTHLGLWLGVCFGVCFLTGLLSHVIQHPPGWFHWTSRPVMLYRVTQGLHVATGLAAIPLLTAKVWSVFPKLFVWPPVRSVPHALERASIALLSAAAVFELVTGLLDITYWYGAMPFAFIAAHYWIGWTAIGALVLHIAVKLPVIRRVLGEKPLPAAGAGLSRRGALGLIGTAAGVITVLTVGQTVRPLRRLALLAPRLPDVGPQGIPVNKTAAAARVTRVADDYRLVVSGPGGRRALSLADLAALPQYTVSLPISCVEGWSAGARWTGIRVVDLLALVGPDDRRVRVDSMEQGGAYRSSILEAGQARDPLTLLALRLNGETLHPDHGYPLRLIAPNRPGVLQTKWVNAVTVVSR
jgi:hypothetical protein